MNEAGAARTAPAGPLQLPIADCNVLCDGLGLATDLDCAMRAIDAARRAWLGVGLLTVNLNLTAPQADDQGFELQRAWSSDPAAYPVAGRKRKALTPWALALLGRGEVFVGEGPAALAAVFDVHARIAALGLQSVVNVPLLRAGRTVATFNLLGPRAQWAPHEVPTIRLLAALARPWIVEAGTGREGAIC